MKIVAVTQMSIVSARGETQDALDRRWVEFLDDCGCIVLPIPNHLPSAIRLLKWVAPDAYVMTGGGDIFNITGQITERDQVEQMILSRAIQSQTPIIGVCRGAQAMWVYCEGLLLRISGHVAQRHLVYKSGAALREVNSYHHFGLFGSPPAVTITLNAEDGSVESFTAGMMLGIMWHPERESDIASQRVDKFVFSQWISGVLSRNPWDQKGAL